MIPEIASWYWAADAEAIMSIGLVSPRRQKPMERADRLPASAGSSRPSVAGVAPACPGRRRW